MLAEEPADEVVLVADADRELAVASSSGRGFSRPPKQSAKIRARTAKPGSPGAKERKRASVIVPWASSRRRSTRLALIAQVISRLAAISSRYLSPKRVGGAVAVVRDAAEARLGLGER